MPVSVATTEDLSWIVSVLQQRREPLVRQAPVFWRPAPDASGAQRAYLEHLLLDGGAKAYRTDDAVLVAVPRGDGWLVDDLHVPGDGWAAGDGRLLWNALDEQCRGADVRLVCPTYEQDRAELARAAGLAVAESWWLLELPAFAGAEAGAGVDVPGAEATIVAAPPVYDPGGAVLFVRSVSDPRTALPAALARAAELGCPAVVVNQVTGDDTLAEALADAGFRRHCDYYTGIIAPL